NRIWCKVIIPILWKLPFGQEYTNYLKLAKKALYDNQRILFRDMIFKKSESFTSTIGDYELIRPLYRSLALICDNILNMDLELDSYSQEQLLVKLIIVQKRIENLSIVAYYNLDYDSISWAIINEKETLKIKLFTNLRNICLDLDSAIPFDTLSAILNYCTNSALYILSNDQVIAIFNNYFNELRRFSFDYGEGFDVD
ncbi:8224_t:CDS:2, partial [Diversispora eburnea]